MDASERAALTARLDGLSRKQLENLAVLVAVRLTRNTAKEEATEPGGAGAEKGGAKGHIELKMIGRWGPYAYRRWWERGHLRSEYLGKVEPGD